MSNRLQKLLDSAIRTHEAGNGALYGWDHYPNYLHPDEWNAMLEAMSAEHRDQLKGERTQTPPRMASAGSSSRFAYSRLKRVMGNQFDKVEFEKECPIETICGTAHLDACIVLGNRVSFIEAKCREIYEDNHKGHSSYAKVYKHVGNGLVFDEETLRLSCNGVAILHFDLKQLICHFLGIAAAILEGKCKPSVQFIYLIFNPSEVKEELGKDWGELKATYVKTLEEIGLFDMELLFASIYNFQSEKLGEKVKYKGDYNFTFHVASQYDLSSLLRPFVHLHTHTEYSLSDGIAKIEALVDKAMADGMPGMAITDHANMFGVAEFVHYVENKNRELGTNFKPIVGCEVYVARRGMAQKSGKEDFAGYHLILLAKNQTGYKNLVKIVSRSWLEGYCGRPRTDHADLERFHEGLICCSACIGGEVAQHILNNDMDAAECAAKWYKSVFGEDYYLELQRHKATAKRANHETFELEERANKQLCNIAQKLDIKLVCANDIHFVDEKDAEVQDALLCINWGKKADDPNRLIFSKQEWLKTTAEMNKLFGDIPEVLENTMEICNKVEHYSIDHAPLLPKPIMPEGVDEVECLARLAFEGAYERYGKPLSAGIKERLKAELRILNSHRCAPIVLMWHEIVSAARNLGAKMGNDRGFSRNSLLLYCLGISQEKPAELGNAFCDYLINNQGLPALELEFDKEGRERVLNWIVERYGEQSVANIASRNVFTAKTASTGGVQEEKLVGVLRKMDIHSCGVAICDGDISEHVPLAWVESEKDENAVIVTQYGGDVLRRIGVGVLYILTSNTLHDNSAEMAE